MGKGGGKCKGGAVHSTDNQINRNIVILLWKPYSVRGCINLDHRCYSFKLMNRAQQKKIIIKLI